MPQPSQRVNLTRAQTQHRAFSGPDGGQDRSGPLRFYGAVANSIRFLQWLWEVVDFHFFQEKKQVFSSIVYAYPL